MAATAGLTFTTTMRVIDHEFHRDAAIVRHHAPSNAYGPLYPGFDIFMLDIARLDRSSRRIHDQHAAEFRRRRLQQRVLAFRFKTNCACAPARLRAICQRPLPGLSSIAQRTTVPAGMFFSGSELPMKMSAVGPDINFEPTCKPAGAGYKALLTVNVI